MAFLNEPGPRAVVLTSALWRKLSPPPTPPEFEVFESPGFNAAKGSFNDLTLVVKKELLAAAGLTFRYKKFWKRRVRMSSLSVLPMTSAMASSASRSSDADQFQSRLSA